jgi:hypothetical protein
MIVAAGDELNLELAHAGRLEEAGQAWRELKDRTPGVSAEAVATFLRAVAIDEATAATAAEAVLKASEAAESPTR